MQVAAEANPGTMAAVLGLDLAGVAEACEETAGAWVANDNTPGQVVVAGTVSGVEEAGRRRPPARRQEGGPPSGGWRFSHSADAARAGPPRCRPGQAWRLPPRHPRWWPTWTPTAHTDGFPPLLSAQLCSRVRWRESLLAMAAMGATLFVELGPGTELSGMVKRTVPDAARANVASPEDLERLASY